MVESSPASAGIASSIPESGRSPGRGHDNPLQCSCLENPMDRGAWRAIVHGAAKSQTRLKRLSTGRRTEGQTVHIDFKGRETVTCDVISENPQNWSSNVDTADEQLYKCIKVVCLAREVYSISCKARKL